MSGAEAGHSTVHTSHPVAPDTLQGWVADLSSVDEKTRQDVLEKAFDFRGDVTLGLRDGSTVEGYIFDRRAGATPDKSAIRLLPAKGDQHVSIPYSQIMTVNFGRDTAHGKSFETWMKKYVEKKLAGERASIEAEVL